MVLRRIAPGDSNRRECFGIRALCRFRKKSNGGDRKSSHVSISRGSMVFFRSHLPGHHIVPKGDELFGREKTGLKIYKRRRRYEKNSCHLITWVLVPISLIGPITTG